MSTSRKRTHSVRNSAKSSGYPAQSTQITYAGQSNDSHWPLANRPGNRQESLETVGNRAFSRESKWYFRTPHERYSFLRFPMTVVGLQVGFHTVSTVSMRSSPFSFARAQSPGPARKACRRMVQNLHFATWSTRTSFARAFWLVQPLRNPSPCQDI